MHLLRLFPILCAVFILVVSVKITDSSKESEFGNATEVKGVIVCNCGKNSYCGIDISKRTYCLCDAGYKYLHGECERCDCGEGESNCDFKGGVRTCSCKDGYAIAETGGACIEKCNDTQPCQNGGLCYENACRCLNGTSGDFCQTVDYCRDTCGKVADCVYNVMSQEAFCKCKDSTLIFDEYRQMCRLCDCGVHAKGCTFVRGKDSCSCWDGYADRSGKCTLCFCTGKSSVTGCRFDEQGNKICNCSQGYEQYEEQCKECDCGPNGKCRFSSWGDKKCNCDEGYSLHAGTNGGTCKECNCGKNGICDFVSRDAKRCRCQYGYELFQGNCERCECGTNANCKWSNLYGKVCTCLPGFALKSDECIPCECGEGINCTFGHYDGTRMCDCPKGYGDDRGTCKVCECGIPGASCTFSEREKECICPKGYELELSTTEHPRISRVCKDIDECQTIHKCPSTTFCVNTLGSYYCICKDGYEIPTQSRNYDIKRDGCQDIDECKRRKGWCNDPYARCVNIPGSYACDCLPGYTLVRQPGLTYNHRCIEGFYPWRISAVVLACFSGVLVVGISCAACRKCRRETKTSL